MAEIQIRELSKSFDVNRGGRPRTIEVLRELSLDVASGETVTFFGPNGCGKSTLIHTIGGILEPTAGTVTANGFRPQDSKTGFVFQNYRETLFPWLTNAENIGFPLFVQAIPKHARAKRVREFLQRLGITIDCDHYPYEQSGGQQQLIAILRALISGPDVVLMDEPFAALDYTTRLAMQDTVLRLLSDTKVTTLLVSHEIDEAIYMADRLVLLSPRPACVLRAFVIPLERPRTRGMMCGGEFAAVRREVIELFQEAIHEI